MNGLPSGLDPHLTTLGRSNEEEGKLGTVGVYAGEWVEEFNVGDADHFRSQAEHARRTAGRALAPEDKAFWLCLAEDWITLAQELDK
jgi:gluconate kinase